ncbi:response regulator [Gordonia aichiensis]|uniref:Putative two-component response regulator n=1 Tax=Gordonia aichiensis NBRC 108223 TaxID=1220583 RepID=L7KQV8_9ACTN|nr:response regulator transcription factor [Gordonia aichiensis]GAC50347.1 putative two-component response regulator [Gordonia aichiensis NBRC 108223]
MTVRVVIADDQTVVREGLRSMLALFDSLDVVGVAASAEEALALVAEQSPDVLLTDLRMPGIGGIEGIRRLVASGSSTRAVALTTYDDNVTNVEALDAGAVGFLNKDADPDAIEAALVSAATGRSLLDEKAMRALLSRSADRSGESGSATGTPDGLTDRETEVVALIAEGLSNQQIARRLVVGVSTVKTHINHILAKTGCRDRAAVVSYAYRHRLV